MGDIVVDERVKEQYKNPDKLNVRANLHSYNIEKTDWNRWCFERMNFKYGAKVLEIGCGNGALWCRNKDRLNKTCDVTLSDFSNGMLESTKSALRDVDCHFNYKVIDVQDIPYGDETFDVVIARHMLYHVPDIEKALLEIKRVLKKDGTFYATTNAKDTMHELHEINKNFDSNIGLDKCGMGGRFNSQNGLIMLEKCFGKVTMETFSQKLVVPEAEPIVSYVASTVKGSTILVGKKREDFLRYVDNIIKINGSITINTKACIFTVTK